MTFLPSMLPPEKRLPACLLFLTLGAFIALFILLSSPSDPKNAVFLGYSLERILLGIGILLPGLALLYLTFSLSRRPDLSLRLWADLAKRGRPGDAIFSLSLAAFIAGSILLLTPPYRLGGLAGYAQRLTPIVGWLAGSGAVTSAILLIERKKAIFKSNESSRIILRIALILFAFLVLCFALIAVTGFGINYPADYWYGAGAPVLGLQVLFSMFAGALVFTLEQKTNLNNKRSDALIFAALWLAAAWLWSRAPLHPNYFMPDTAGNALYPYSDGATFDQGAQYALIGQGLFNGVFFERVLYSVFLTYLHGAFGQDFELLMTAQAALFAVFPAVIYLLGRELHGRALGVAAGALIALRGVNAIVAAKWIDTASPKMMLTDFPAAVLIAVFLLLFVKWIKTPSRPGLLGWMGAVFGYAFMVRTHALALLPVAFIFIPVALKWRWRQTALAGTLFLLGLFAVTLPWEIRNQSRGIPMYSAYYSRIIVILRHRYGLDAGAYLPPREADASHAAAPSRVSTRQRAFIPEPLCESTLCSIANHLVHNAATSIVSLPSSLTFDDLWNTVKADTPYWKKSWSEGRVGTAGGMMIVLNLALISLGVGSIWGRGKTLALLPISVFLAYLLVNSLSFTSGGRYIAPVDWIVCLFYIAGGLQLLSWLMTAAGFLPADESTATAGGIFPALTGKTFSGTLPTLLFILAFGALLPASEIFFAPRYQPRSAEKTLAGLEESGLLEQTGFSKDELTAFLSQPNAMIREGRILYPRYYRSGEGEPDRSTYYRYLDYQRLVFTLIGPNSPTPEGVVIPGDPPPFSFHAEDAIVLGCWNTTYYAPYLDAVAVFVTSGEGYVYTRFPSAPLQCPLPEPR